MGRLIERTVDRRYLLLAVSEPHCWANSILEAKVDKGRSIRFRQFPPSDTKPSMNLTSSHSARFHVGTIEPGARGPILRDADGLCWRLGFVDGSAADGLSGRVRVRGRIVDVDRIEVEYVEAQDEL